VTFKAYGPDDSDCSGTAAFTSTNNVTANHDATSDPFTPRIAGTYRWTADYSGDSANDPASSACNAANETSSVAKASPWMYTTASGPVAIGGSISDTSRLVDAATTDGTVTFKAYGPDDTDCSGTAVFTSVAPVGGSAQRSNSGPFTPTALGVYRWTANYSGDVNNQATSSGCNARDESSTVTKHATSLTTHASGPASGPVAIGGSITDTATLARGASPTGTITFKVYGPDDGTCSGTVASTSSKNVTDNGDVTSDAFTPTALGVYRWTADYSGDATNDPASSGCNAADESSTVSKQTVFMQTQASGPVTIGNSITDTASFSATYQPTFTVTFEAYGPDDTDCSGTPAFTSTKGAPSSGQVTSDAFTPAAPGVYRWKVTTGPDQNNDVRNPGRCNDPGESSTVNKHQTSLTTQASGGVALGGSVNDTATLSGGSSPGGTITFQVYGPDDTSCSSAAVFTSSKNVSDNGDVTSGSFTPTAPGTYRWTAAYSGDGTNGGAAGKCNDANESVTVAKTTPGLTTKASADVELGGAVNDVATLSGGTGATGTITFKLFGPDDASCAGTPAFTSTQPVSGNGDVTSDGFIPTAPGVYRWVASYGGDAKNAAVSGACGDSGESATVTKRTASLATAASTVVTLGGSMTDSATLAGGASPSGTITFKLYGPDDANCSGTPAFTSTKSVAGNGEVTSGAFTPTAAGVYRWVASYSGDTNNAAVAGACGDQNESTTVNKAASSTALESSNNPSTQGEAVTFTATVSAPHAPTGQVTFKDGSVTLGSQSLSAGHASLTTADLTTGDHTISAHYEGDEHLTASSSADLTQHVAAKTPAGPGENPKPPKPQEPPTIRIIHHELGLDGGLAPVTLACKGTTGQSCRGSVRLKATSFTSRLQAAGNGSLRVRFNIAAGNSKRILLPLPAATRARLTRLHKAVAIVMVTLSGNPVGHPSRAITLFAH
jgi:hypothetical protein